MDTQLVEKLDRKRNRFLLLQAIGVTSFLIVVVLEDYVKIGSGIVGIILALIAGFGIGLALAASLKSIALNRKIKSDAKLNQALNNELFQLYVYKSLRWGYIFSSLTAAVIGSIASGNNSVTASQACWLILLTGSVAAMISRLIYNRN